MSDLTIAPIGTCRINTPLMRGAARYPINLDCKRVYGFVHTSAEALQQLLYRAGEHDFLSETLPLLVRPGDNHWSEPAPSKPADLTIVEISSGKDCRAGDVAVQSNYLESYFSDFFVPAERYRRASAFWELARRRDRERLKAFLEADPVYLRYGERDQALLRSISVRDQEYDDVLADMTAITELLDKSRILFVTHINATRADGALIAPRDKHIRWVKQAAQALGVECFDPTPLMREFGQEKALERGGLDTTHYTNAFSDRLYALIHRQYVLPLMGGVDAGEDVGAAADTVLSDSIAAAIEDDFCEGSRQLFSAIKTHRDHPVLSMLRGQVLAYIGDYEGASELLTARIDDVEMTPGTRKAAMRVLLETGDAAGALKVANRLLSDEYEEAEIYEAAGLAAERLDRLNDAVHYRKLAFRLSPSNYSTATSVLDHYRKTGDSGHFTAWLQEVLDVLESQGNVALARGITEWAIATRDPTAIASALVVLARYDAVVFPALLADALRVGMHAEVAPAVAAVAKMSDLNDGTVRALRTVASEWVGTSRAALEAGKLSEAYFAAAACAAVVPNNRVALRLQRSALAALAAKVREALKARNDAAVVDLCASAGEMVFHRRDTGLAFVRALTKLGQLADAQAAATRLHEAWPEDVESRAALAQVADMNGDFLTAFGLYSDLAAESAQSTARHTRRIERFMTKARKTGVRHVRALAAEGRFGDAIELCHLIETGSENPALVAAELKRILFTLRARLRQSDGQDGTYEAFDLLQLMLKIAPNDPSILRGAAREAGKRQEFGLALELWNRLEAVEPGVQSTALQIKRSKILLARQTQPPQRRVAVPPPRPRAVKGAPLKKARAG